MYVYPCIALVLLYKIGVQGGIHYTDILLVDKEHSREADRRQRRFMIKIYQEDNVLQSFAMIPPKSDKRTPHG